MSNKLAAKTLVSKVEKIVKERMAAADVVSFAELQSLNKERAPRLLIIDDDESIRKSLTRLFEGEGYQISAVESATQLNDVVDHFVFDLILLDVNLPWLNGYELATMMKEHSDLKDIPLVFISGNQDIPSIKQGFVVGADDYIKKPFDLNRVKKTVATLLALNRD